MRFTEKRLHMHELGVLCHAMKTVDQIAQKNNIQQIRFVTLEVGNESSVLPEFFVKLYPIAVEKFPRLERSTLKIEITDGNGLSIKEIGY